MKTKRKPGRPVNESANWRHPLYLSWKSHRHRGVLWSTSFPEFVAKATLSGWRPDVGQRVFVDSLTEDVSVYRAIYEFAEYRLWIRMMTSGCIGDRSTVCIGWHDFFTFRDWVRGICSDVVVDYTKPKFFVCRRDASRFYGPSNCYIGGVV